MANKYKKGTYFLVNNPEIDYYFIGIVTKVKNGLVEYKVICGKHPPPDDDDRYFTIGSPWDKDFVKIISEKTAKTLYERL